MRSKIIEEKRINDQRNGTIKTKGGRRDRYLSIEKKNSEDDDSHQ
jgi:hypothetical protein